jgi:hypothetical protein
VYAPDVKARHTGGASVGSLPPSHRELYWYVSLLRYASKHYGALNFRLVSAAVALGSVLRASVGLMRGRGFEPALTYAKVIQVAGGCLLSGAARLQRPVAGPVSIQAESASEEATPRAGNTTNRNELHVL